MKSMTWLYHLFVLSAPVWLFFLAFSTMIFSLIYSQISMTSHSSFRPCHLRFSYFWSCQLWLVSLISSHFINDVSGLVIYDMTLLFLVLFLFPVLSSMTWLFYFQPCHIIFGLVSFDVTILFLVLSSMTRVLFLVPSSMTWLSYFWSCLVLSCLSVSYSSYQ